MNDPAQQQWFPRPSFFASRVIRAVFFLLPITGGLIVLLWLTEARDLSKVAMWQVLFFAVSLAMVLPVATLVMKWLRGRGVFGSVRLDGAWLKMGGREDAIDLVRPFEADLRNTFAQIERTIPGGGAASRRTHVQNIYVLAAVLRQDGKSFTLYCDHHERDTGVRAGPYDLTGLPVRPLPLLEPEGKVFRMEPDDLTDVLRAVKDAEGWSGNKAIAADDADQGKRRKDPRAPFAKLLQTILAVVVLVGLSAGAVWAVFGHYDAIRQQESAERRAEVDRQRRELEAKCEPLIGRWVRTAKGFRNNECIYGRVTKHFVHEDTFRSEVVAELTIRVEAFGTVGKPGYRRNVTQYYQYGSEAKTKGSQVTADLDEVKFLDDPPQRQALTGAEARARARRDEAAAKCKPLVGKWVRVSGFRDNACVYGRATGYVVHEDPLKPGEMLGFLKIRAEAFGVIGEAATRTDAKVYRELGTDPIAKGAEILAQVGDVEEAVPPKK